MPLDGPSGLGSVCVLSLTDERVGQDDDYVGRDCNWKRPMEMPMRQGDRFKTHNHNLQGALASRSGGPQARTERESRWRQVLLFRALVWLPRSQTHEAIIFLSDGLHVSRLKCAKVKTLIISGLNQYLAREVHGPLLVVSYFNLFLFPASLC